MNSNFLKKPQTLFGISCKAGKVRMKCDSIDFAQWHSQRGPSNPPHRRFLFFVILLSVLVARTSLLSAPSTRQQDAEQLKSLIDELNGRAAEIRPPETPRSAAPVDPLPFTPDQKTLAEGYFLSRIAVAAARLDDTNRALTVADRLTLPFQKAEALARIAEELDLRGQPAEAARLRAGATSPEFPDFPAHYAMESASRSLKEGKVDEARRHFDRALKLVSTNWPFDKGNTVFGFARMLHEAGYTNEASSNVLRGLELTRPLLNHADGNVLSITLRDIAQLQATLQQFDAAISTADLIRDPEQWSSARILIQREQLRAGNKKGAEEILEQLIRSAEKDAISVKVWIALRSATELGADLAQEGNVESARKLMLGALERLREPASRTVEEEAIKKFEEEIPATIASRLLDGKHYAHAAAEIPKVKDPQVREFLESRLVVERTDARSGAIEPASSLSESAKQARAAIRAQKAVSEGRFGEALQLTENLTEREALPVLMASGQSAIKSNNFAQARSIIDRFDRFPKGAWQGHDFGLNSKLHLLEELAGAQAARGHTNEALRTWREAAALCSKSDDYHLHSRLARIAMEMVRLGDAGGAMNALKSHTGTRTSELAPPTGAALLKTLGTSRAIQVARTQTDKQLQLYLLLGILEGSAELRMQ